MAAVAEKCSHPPDPLEFGTQFCVFTVQFWKRACQNHGSDGEMSPPRIPWNLARSSAFSQCGFGKKRAKSMAAAAENCPHPRIPWNLARFSAFSQCGFEKKRAKSETRRIYGADGVKQPNTHTT